MHLCIFKWLMCPKTFQGIIWMHYFNQIWFLKYYKDLLFLLKWKRQSFLRMTRLTDRALQITHAYKYDYNHNMPILSANAALEWKQKRRKQWAFGLTTSKIPWLQFLAAFQQSEMACINRLRWRYFENWAKCFGQVLHENPLI